MTTFREQYGPPAAVSGEQLTLAINPDANPEHSNYGCNGPDCRASYAIRRLTASGMASAALGNGPEGRDE